MHKTRSIVRPRAYAARLRRRVLFVFLGPPVWVVGASTVISQINPISFLPGVGVVGIPSAAVIWVCLAPAVLLLVLQSVLCLHIARRFRKADWSLCPGCGYSLAGLTRSVPCPECGSIVDVNSLRAWWKRWLWLA